MGDISLPASVVRLSKHFSSFVSRTILLKPLRRLSFCVGVYRLRIIFLKFDLFLYKPTFNLYIIYHTFLSFINC